MTKEASHHHRMASEIKIHVERADPNHPQSIACGDASFYIFTNYR